MTPGAEIKKASVRWLSGFSRVLKRSAFTRSSSASKGMMKPLKDANPDINIVAIDYDPGASEVNQLNRIKLMLSTAFKKNK